MSRLQLALNVADVDEAVTFYSKLFGVEPAKRQPGYANFAIAEPPLKLVLIAGSGEPGSLNHLGVEVESTDEVTAATRRLAAGQLDTETEEAVDCCYAIQDKVWVTGPGGERWEVYTVLADSQPVPVSAGATTVGPSTAGTATAAAGSSGDTLGCSC